MIQMQCTVTPFLGKVHVTVAEVLVPQTGGILILSEPTLSSIAHHCLSARYACLIILYVTIRLIMELLTLDLDY